MDPTQKKVAKVMKECPDTWVEKLVEIGITNSVRRANGIVIYVASDVVEEMLGEGKVAPIDQPAVAQYELL